jgi:hypothetical protein
MQNRAALRFQNRNDIPFTKLILIRQIGFAFVAFWHGVASMSPRHAPNVEQVLLVWRGS